jgi:hypothetical protein
MPHPCVQRSQRPAQAIALDKLLWGDIQELGGGALLAQLHKYALSHHGASE